MEIFEKELPNSYCFSRTEKILLFQVENSANSHHILLYVTYSSVLGNDGSF